jgi:hypothetical protein
MLHSNVISVKLESGEREVFVSPFLLQAKKPAYIQSGKIEVLYFYDQLQDDVYKKEIEKEVLPEKFKSDRYIMITGKTFKVTI